MNSPVDDTNKSEEIKDDESFVEDAVKKFDAASEYYAEEYERGTSDVEFTFGDQWKANILAVRDADKRPSLVENRCLPFVHQVVNSVRQSNPSITVHPVDDKADVETAEVLQGMIRNIEVRSNASTSYDTSVWNAATFCRGWIRVNTEYAYGSFDQDITIGRVINPESVFIDPNHTEMDGKDAEYLFIFDDMDKDEFKETYPKAKIEGFEVAPAGDSWISDKTVRVAEYYKKEYETVILALTADGVMKESEVPEGVEVLETREERQCTIKWYKITNTEILEQTTWEGKYIPVVPVLGVESYLEGKRQMFSLIHPAKDPQQMLNYWKSAGVEIVAMQPKAPYIGAVGQFETAAEEWRDANSRNFAALEYDIVTDENGVPVPPPQRQAPPQGSLAMIQETTMAAEGINATLGMYNASMGGQSSEISGSAIQQRKLQGDNGTFHFIDNLAVALNHVGVILVDLIPKIYTGKRMARIIGIDGVPSIVPINQAYSKNQKGDLIPTPMGAQSEGFYKIDAGKYDVVVDVSSSYATRRQEAVSSMLEVAGIDPRVMQAAPDLFFDNLDIPGGKELAKRMKTLIDPSLLEDDPMAAQLAQAQQAMQQMEGQIGEMQMALQVKQDNSQAEIAQKNQEISIKQQEVEIEAAHTAAKIKKLEAEASIEIPAEAMKDVSEAVKELDDGLQDVREAVNVILELKENEGNAEPEEIGSNPNGEEGNDGRSKY